MSENFFENYKKIQELGQGGESCVWLVESPKHRLVAAREIRGPFVNNDPLYYKHVIRELLFLKHTKHENIINALDYYMEEDETHFVNKIFIVMPRMECSLWDYVHDRAWRINEEYRNCYLREIMAQLLYGLDYLHQNRIIHRDLSMRNVMLVNYKDGQLNLKIIDFGLARNYVTHNIMTDNMITFNFRPWEVAAQVDYDYKADMWSVGCIFAELISSEPLCKCTINGIQASSSNFGVLIRDILSVAELPGNFDQVVFLENSGLDHLMTQFPVIERHLIDERFPDSVFPIITEPYDDPAVHTAANMRDLLKKLLQLLPEHRYSAAEALQHPYLGRPIKQPEPLINYDYVHQCLEIIEDENPANFETYVNIFEEIRRIL